MKLKTYIGGQYHMNNNKILYVSTLSSTINAFLVDHIMMLNENGFLVDIAANINHSLNDKIGPIVTNIINLPFSRNPFSFKNFQAYRLLKKELITNSYSIINTHTPVASAVVRLAARKSKTKVIYTAHGFHFHKRGRILNWLIYYPIEKFLARYTHTIVTINKEDYQLAKSRFGVNKVLFINGVGFNFSKYHYPDRVYGENQVICFISVGELNKNKNHSRVIKALSKIKFDYRYLIIGEGPNRKKLSRLIKSKRLGEKVELLGYRNDVSALYKKSDIFIFPSLREGLGNAAIEAMASGLPIITSNVHGINDYSKENISGCKFNPKSIQSIYRAISKMISQKDLWPSYGKRNIEISRNYDTSIVLTQISDLFQLNNIADKGLSND